MESVQKNCAVWWAQIEKLFSQTLFRMIIYCLDTFFTGCIESKLTKNKIKYLWYRPCHNCNLDWFWFVLQWGHQGDMATVWCAGVPSLSMSVYPDSPAFPLTPPSLLINLRYNDQTWWLQQLIYIYIAATAYCIKIISVLCKCNFQVLCSLVKRQYSSLNINDWLI